MAEGIRIAPRQDLNWPIGPYMVVIVDHDRPFLPALDSEGRPIPLERTQPVCSICEAAQNGHRQHFCKAYHIQLGGDGTTIVSTGVWEGIKACAEHPFEVVNPVPQPPAQHIVVPTAKVKVTPGITGGA